jgi:hypothetical protein
MAHTATAQRAPQRHLYRIDRYAMEIRPGRLHVRCTATAGTRMPCSSGKLACSSEHKRSDKPSVKSRHAGLLELGLMNCYSCTAALSARLQPAAAWQVAISQ